jgi:hypothetical protein
VHPDHRADVARQWAEAVRSGTPVDTRVRLHHAPSGGWRLTRLRAIPLRNSDGGPRGWLGTTLELGEPGEAP